MAILSKVVGLSLLLGGRALDASAFVQLGAPQATSRHIPGLHTETKEGRNDGTDAMVRDAGSSITNGFKNIGHDIKKGLTDNAAVKAVTNKFEKMKAKATEVSTKIGKGAEKQFEKAKDSPIGKKLQEKLHTKGGQATTPPLLNAQKKVAYQAERANGGWTHFDDVNPWEGDIDLMKAEGKIMKVKEGPNDAMIDHMWSMKNPTDKQIKQTWLDMFNLVKTHEEQSVMAKELNAWISAVMDRRKKALEFHESHPLGANPISFYKEGRLVTEAEQPVDMSSNLDSLPNTYNLAHLPSDDMVEALWQFDNPTNAQIKQAWAEMMKPTQTEDEKLLVSKEVKEWIKYIMNKRAARLYKHHA